MVQVVELITGIEAKANLFSLRDKNGLPIWDIIRYDVIKHIQYHYNVNKETVPHSSIWKRCLILQKSIKPFIRLLGVKHRRFLFYTEARNIDEKGYYYDRQAIDLINQTSPKERIIFDELGGKVFAERPYELPQAFFYFLHKCRFAFSHNDRLKKETVDKIVEAVNDGFNSKVIDDGAICSLYIHFISLCEMFDWIIRRVSPQKVIVSYGRYKAISYVAKKYRIPSFLIQHSLIDISDATIGGTCPSKEDGVNPDVLLTYGSYWGDYLRHLMDVWVLGNRYLYKAPTSVYDDGTVVFISSLYQGPYLANLLRMIAPHYPQRGFVFKLHPGEKGRKDYYSGYFKGILNISVQLNEEPLDLLLCRCSIVVLISSTTLFEALNIGKCVALYEHPDFKDVTSFLRKAPNTYCFDTVKQLYDIIECHQFKHIGMSYYEDLNMSIVQKVLG